MKICDISYEEVLKRHPLEANHLVLKLRKGKSKSRLEVPESLSWTYECCVLIEGSGSFADLISGKMMSEARKRDAMTIDAKIADQIRRTRVSLNARHGRWWGAESINTPPPELEANVRASFERDAQEKARVEHLTPAQRQAEVNELLRQLGRDPGFMVLSLPMGEDE